jgi:hypothetical protein
VSELLDFVGGEIVWWWVWLLGWRVLGWWCRCNGLLYL